MNQKEFDATIYFGNDNTVKLQGVVSVKENGNGWIVCTMSDTDQTAKFRADCVLGYQLSTPA